MYAMPKEGQMYAQPHVYINIRITYNVCLCARACVRARECVRVCVPQSCHRLTPHAGTIACRMQFLVPVIALQDSTVSGKDLLTLVNDELEGWVVLCIKS